MKLAGWLASLIQSLVLLMFSEDCHTEKARGRSGVGFERTVDLTSL